MSRRAPPAVAGGETIGRRADEQIKVRLMLSERFPGMPVVVAQAHAA